MELPFSWETRVCSPYASQSDPLGMGGCLALFVMFWGFWSLPVSKLLTLFIHFMELPTLPHPFNPITLSGRNLASRIESTGLPWWSVVKNLPVNVGDVSSVPGWGRCPGEGNGNPLQYSCLEHSMDRGAWRATVHRVAKSRTQLSN